MQTFVLPKGHVMEIDCEAQANYTQAAIFLLQRPDGFVVNSHRWEGYWEGQKFYLPAVASDYDVQVRVSGKYKYDDSRWGDSRDKLTDSNAHDKYYIFGFDDGDARSGHDDDYDDMIVVVHIRAGNAPKRVETAALVKAKGKL